MTLRKTKFISRQMKKGGSGKVEAVLKTRNFAFNGSEFCDKTRKQKPA